MTVMITRSSIIICPPSSLLEGETQGYGDCVGKHTCSISTGVKYGIKTEHLEIFLNVINYARYFHGDYVGADIRQNLEPFYQCYAKSYFQCTYSSYAYTSFYNDCKQLSGISQTYYNFVAVFKDKQCTTLCREVNSLLTIIVNILADCNKLKNTYIWDFNHVRHYINYLYENMGGFCQNLGTPLVIPDKTYIGYNSYVSRHYSCKTYSPPPTAAPAYLPPSNDCIKLYEHPDRQGASIEVCDTTNYDYFGARGWNDRVSSVCAGANFQWQLFEHSNFVGISYLVDKGKCENLPGYFNDMLSSVRKVDTPATAQAGCFRMWEHPNRGGQTIEVCDTKDTPYFTELGWNDRVSYVCAGTTFDWQIYQNSNYQGISYVIPKGQCLNVPLNLDNHLSSVRKLDGSITSSQVPAGCIILYEHTNRQGASIQVCGTQNYDFFGARGWNDIVSSFCASSGTRWQLFQHSDFQGFSVIVESGQCTDVPSYFNDHMSSIRKL